MHPTHRAAPSVPAGAGITLVYLQLTVGTCVPRPAGTCVAPLAGVTAGGSIPAWLMVSAVVQICQGGDSRGDRKPKVKYRKNVFFQWALGCTEETWQP